MKFVTNRWYVVTYVKRGKRLEMWVDGSRHKTRKLKSAVIGNNGNLYVGNSPWLKGFGGKMDNF